VADGDIGSVKDTIEFDGVASVGQRIVKCYDDIVAYFFCNSSSNQKVISVEVDSAGLMPATPEDSLAFNGGWCGYCDLLFCHSDILLMIHRGAASDGWLATAEIDTAGAISNALLDDLEYDTVASIKSRIIEIIPGWYAFIYEVSAGPGWLMTVSCSTSGVLPAAVQDSFEFDSVYYRAGHLCMVGDDYIAIVWEDTDHDGQLCTVSVNGSGNLGSSCKDTYEFETSDCLDPFIIHMQGNIYAIVYTGPGDEGWIKTVEIDDEGNITEPFKDDFKYLVTAAYDCEACKISDTLLAIVATGSGDDGFLTVVEIDSDGIITDPVYDSLEFDTTMALYPSICHVLGDIYAIGYRSAADKHKIKTVEIESPSLARPHHEMIVGMGP